MLKPVRRDLLLTIALARATGVGARLGSWRAIVPGIALAHADGLALQGAAA